MNPYDGGPIDHKQERSPGEAYLRAVAKGFVLATRRSSLRSRGVRPSHDARMRHWARLIKRVI